MFSEEEIFLSLLWKDCLCVVQQDRRTDSIFICFLFICMFWSAWRLFYSSLAFFRCFWSYCIFTFAYYLCICLQNVFSSRFRCPAWVTLWRRWTRASCQLSCRARRPSPCSCFLRIARQSQAPGLSCLTPAQAIAHSCCCSVWFVSLAQVRNKEVAHYCSWKLLLQN